MVKCPICFENLSRPYYDLDCHHSFCVCCIIEWAAKKLTCPLCRVDIINIPMLITLKTPWELVKKYIDLPWDWKTLSWKRDLPWEIVEKNPEKNWSWSCLSNRPDLSWKLVENHLNWDWSLYCLSIRKDIPVRLSKKIKDMALNKCEQQLRALYTKHGGKQEE